MQPDPQRVLQIAQELDPVLIERAILRALNEEQAKQISLLTERLQEIEPETSDDS